MATPEPPGYDTLFWPDDALAVWVEAGDDTRAQVRDAMPELAAALDRQAEVVKTPRRQRRPRFRDPNAPRRPVPWPADDEGSDRAGD